MTGRTRALVLAVLASARGDKTLAPMLSSAESRLGSTVESSIKQATWMDLSEPLREVAQRHGAKDIALLFEATSVQGAATMHELPPRRRRTVESIASHLWDAAERLRAEFTVDPLTEPLS